jgi:hypothetical protein
LNRLNKRILGIVNGCNRIKEKVLWCKLSKKKNCGIKIEIKSNEGQYVNTRKMDYKCPIFSLFADGLKQREGEYLYDFLLELLLISSIKMCN